jgi:hypothetical protein
MAGKLQLAEHIPVSLAFESALLACTDFGSELPLAVSSYRRRAALMVASAFHSPAKIDAAAH